MSLKQQMRADIDNVFLNAREFAERHEIDGKRLLCVVEESDSVPHPTAIGTHIRTITVYVKARLLAGRPAPDSSITVDGKKWKVASVVEEFGLYTLKLEAART